MVTKPLKTNPAALLESNLKGLDKILDAKRGPTKEAVAKWKRGVVGTALDRVVIGRVEWDKALGRPMTPTLAAGFDIEAWRWEEFMEYTPQGVRFVSLKFNLPVSSWDGKDDSEKHRVYFALSGVPNETEHFVEARFVRGSRWTPRGKFSIASSGPRVIRPSVLPFKRESAMFLPPFEVLIANLADL